VPKSVADGSKREKTMSDQTKTNGSDISTSALSSKATIAVPANSKTTLEDNKNYAYKEESSFNHNINKTVLSYDRVELQPVKYEPHQTLESVVAEEEFVPMTRSQYIEKYRKAEAASARETLKMCRLVYEANKSLNSGEFAAFCDAIGYKDYSSVIRKFIIIGKIEPRLISHADRLPASWSSIYLITQIPAQSFENLIEMNRSFKDLKVSEVNKLVQETRDLNQLDKIIKPALRTAQEVNDALLNSTILAKVYFTKMPDDLDWHAFEKALMEVQANLPVRIQLLSTARDVFTKRKDKRYEQLKEAQAPSPFKPETWDLGREVAKMNTENLKQVEQNLATETKRIHVE
jgi:hypothetical protein